MRRFFKWVMWIIGSLLGLALIALAYIYIDTHQKIHQTYEVNYSLENFELPTDSASIAEGKRLARIKGCFDGCHGKGAEGGPFAQFGISTRLPAPNLTKAIDKYSMEEFEKIVRHGIRPDGTGVIAMPSDMFYNLSNEDLGKIMAFLKSLPEKEGPDLPDRNIGPLARTMMVINDLPLFKAEEIDHQAPRIEADPEVNPVKYGKYLAVTTCTECHGMNLMGNGDQTPALTVVSGYTNEDLKHLFKTGEALGGRELELMSSVSRSRFSHFTDEEVEAIHAYLSTMGNSSGEVREITAD